MQNRVENVHFILFYEKEGKEKWDKPGGAMVHAGQQNAFLKTGRTKHPEQHREEISGRLDCSAAEIVTSEPQW